MKDGDYELGIDNYTSTDNLFNLTINSSHEVYDGDIEIVSNKGNEFMFKINEEAPDVVSSIDDGDSSMDISARPLINPWIRDLSDPSMPEVANSVHVHTGEGVPWYRTLRSYCGPGSLVAVGLLLYLIIKSFF